MTEVLTEVLREPPENARKVPFGGSRGRCVLTNVENSSLSLSPEPGSVE